MFTQTEKTPLFTPVLMIQKSFFYIILSFLAISCGGGCPIVEDAEIISAYHQNSFESTISESSSDQLDVYLDYSDGMHPAINQNYDFFEEVLTILDQRDAKYYKAGYEKPYEIKEIFDKNSPYNPRYESSFSDTRSYLKNVVDLIVKHKSRQAIFITDFERVEKNTVLAKQKDFIDGKKVVTDIDPSPWATKQFTEWLAAGNAIDIFARRYLKYKNEADLTQDRYLYFIVFTPKKLLESPSKRSIFHRMSEEGYADEKPSDGRAYFGFSLGRHSLSPSYKPNPNGGSNNEIAPFAHEANLSEKFEYYQFAFSDIGYLNELEPEEDYTPDKRILQGLSYIRNLSSFDHPEFEIEVENISSGFKAFSDSVLFADPYLKTSGAEANGIFELSYLQEKQELGISVETRYEGMGSACELYRIKIILKKAKLNLPISEMNEYLQWEDRRNVETMFVVSSLNESLKEAMKRQQLENLHLFTYYVELLNK